VVDEVPAPLQPPRASAAGAGFLANVNLVFSSTAVVYGLSFLVGVTVARLLGPDGRGASSLYQGTVSLAYAALSVGIGAAAIYFVSKGELSPRRAMEEGLTVTIAASAVSGLAVAIVAPLAGGRLVDAGVPYWMLLIAVPAAVQFRAVEGVLRAQGRFLAVGIIEVLVPLANLVGLLAVDAAYGLTIWRAIEVWSVASLLPVCLGYALLGPSAWPTRLGMGAGLRRTLGFGVKGQAGNLVQLLNYRLDAYLVLLFVNTAGVGLYSVGVSMSEGLWFVANSVAVVLLPKLSAADDDYAGETASLICRNTMAVTALGAVALAIVSPLLVPALFGAAFEKAVGPLLWLLPGSVALSGAKILSVYVFSRGRPDINSWISVATLVITLAADFALIPFFGINGAALAATLTYIANLVLTTLAYRRLSGRPIAEALLPRFADQALYVDALRGTVARLRPGGAAAAPTPRPGGSS